MNKKEKMKKAFFPENENENEKQKRYRSGKSYYLFN